MATQHEQQLTCCGIPDPSRIVPGAGAIKAGCGGRSQLRDKAGATIHLGRRAEAEFSCVKMKNGDVIEYGDVKLEIMETPGHTPEGISILVYDLAKSRLEGLMTRRKPSHLRRYDVPA